MRRTNSSNASRCPTRCLDQLIEVCGRHVEDDHHLIGPVEVEVGYLSRIGTLSGGDGEAHVGLGPFTRFRPVLDHPSSVPRGARSSTSGASILDETRLEQVATPGLGWSAEQVPRGQ